MGLRYRPPIDGKANRAIPPFFVPVSFGGEKQLANPAKGGNFAAKINLHYAKAISNDIICFDNSSNNSTGGLVVYE